MTINESRVVKSHQAFVRKLRTVIPHRRTGSTWLWIQSGARTPRARIARNGISLRHIDAPAQLRKVWNSHYGPRMGHRMWMTMDVRDSILGHMGDFFIAEPTTEHQGRLGQNQTTDEETLYMKFIDKWFSSHWAHSVVHRQKPLTVSQALADIPIGLLGWFWDVNCATSNGYPYTEKELITDAMMMYISGPYAGIRAYLGFQFCNPVLRVILASVVIIDTDTSHNFPTQTCPRGSFNGVWAMARSLTLATLGSQ
ncbi:hypothetical protein CMEL01_14894 [Colletotrichum melonis]|uniref:Uncharacterized protein n=1 Tax=Colletotrichum melonis TaxID=1209925 RepID=A0AAI9UQG5_9PEZI|nr:hypothetical protein CMEL01_14894 [Colletotrichum melonis]